MVRAAPVLLLAACFPPPLDESGRRCDAERACGAGWVCFEGFCTLPEAVDAGPDNWLLNPSFEQVNDAGNPLFWRSMPAASGGEIITDTTYVHEGRRSVRLYSLDGGDQAGVMVTAANEVRPTVFGQVWCARAWVRSSTDAGFLVGLYLRERIIDGGVTVGENTPNRVRVPASWTLFEERYVAEGADR
ncbi:MAG: hypothetical protein JNK82_25610, partial [Myxococcaceae bacterium]|nr:hypothetical protein [Myxococcaceae bacterium]